MKSIYSLAEREQSQTMMKLVDNLLLQQPQPQPQPRQQHEQAEHKGEQRREQKSAGSRSGLAVEESWLRDSLENSPVPALDVDEEPAEDHSLDEEIYSVRLLP